MSKALDTLREKLDYLQQQEAIQADPAQKFALAKEIAELNAKIADLERSDNNQQAKTSNSQEHFAPCGAASFGPEDGALFEHLCRDEELNKLMKAIGEKVPLIQVHGVSGSGKTSLLHSGLAHRCKQKRYHYWYWEALPGDEESLLQILANVADKRKAALSDGSGIEQIQNQSFPRYVVVLDRMDRLPPRKNPLFWKQAIEPALTAPANFTTIVLAYERGLHGDIDAYRDAVAGDAARTKPVFVDEFDLETAKEVLQRLIKASGYPEIDNAVATRLLSESRRTDQDTILPVMVGILHLVVVNQLRRKQKITDLSGQLSKYVESSVDDIVENHQERRQLLDVLLALHSVDEEHDEEREVEINQSPLPSLQEKTAADLARATQWKDTSRLDLLLRGLAKSDVRILEKIEHAPQLQPLPEAEVYVPVEAERPRYRLTHKQLIPAIQLLAGKKESPSLEALRQFRRLFRVWTNEKNSRQYLLADDALKKAEKWKPSWSLPPEQEDFFEQSRQAQDERVFNTYSSRAVTAIASLTLLFFVGWFIHDQITTTSHFIDVASVTNLADVKSNLAMFRSKWISSNTVKSRIRTELEPTSPNPERALRLILALSLQKKLDRQALAKELLPTEQNLESLRELIIASPKETTDAITKEQWRDQVTATACLLALAEGKKARWDAEIIAEQSQGGGHEAPESKTQADQSKWWAIYSAVSDYIRSHPSDAEVLAEVLEPAAPAISRYISTKEPFESGAFRPGQTVLAEHVSATMLVSAWLRTQADESKNELISALRDSPYNASDFIVEKLVPSESSIPGGDVTLRFELIDRLGSLLHPNELVALMKSVHNEPDLVYSLAVAFGKARSKPETKANDTASELVSVLAGLDLRNASHEALRLWLTCGEPLTKEYEKLISRKGALIEKYKERKFANWYLNSNQKDVDQNLDWKTTLDFLRNSPVTPASMQRVENRIERHDPRNWYHTPNGITMVELPGGAGLRGDHEIEPTDAGKENFVAIQIEPFDISMTEVTVGQFLDFFQHDKQNNPNTKLQGRNTLSGLEAFNGEERDYSMHIACPAINNVNLFTAASFCNWLTELEYGRESGNECYAIDRSDLGKPSLTILPGRSGYRLPTVNEWEYACRAGSKKRWFFGDNERLLTCYSRTQQNSRDCVWPVGSLPPNPFGIFDMHGNAGEWTSDVVQAKPFTPAQTFNFPEPRILTINKDSLIAWCGGEIYMRPVLDRCARRIKDFPVPGQLRYYGIRVARNGVPTK